MGRLEVRMDAVVKQIESLRKDLDDHFDGVNQRLDLLYLGIDSIADILRERLPIPENPDTSGHTPAFVPGDEDPYES